MIKQVNIIINQKRRQRMINKIDFLNINFFFYFFTFTFIVVDRININVTTSIV
jgi:hypothetical protein